MLLIPSHVELPRKGSKMNRRPWSEFPGMFHVSQGAEKNPT